MQVVEVCSSLAITSWGVHSLSHQRKLLSASAQKSPLAQAPLCDAHYAPRCKRGQTATVPAESAATEKPPTEAALIAAILSGEAHLYEELIRPYRQRVRAMAFAYMKNEEDAEDVVQEASTKAFRYLSSFRQNAQFGTWLISITLNEARQHIRKRNSLRATSLVGISDSSHLKNAVALIDDPRKQPSAIVEREELRRILWHLIHNLPANYRKVYLLRDVEELDTRAVADVLKISIGTVKVRLHRSRMMLRKGLSPLLQSHRPLPTSNAESENAGDRR